METLISLESFLERWHGENARARQVAEVVRRLAGAAGEIAGRLRLGRLGFQGVVDPTHALVSEAEARLRRSLEGAPVAFVATETTEELEAQTPGSPLAVALDALDSAEGVDSDLPQGTLFSLLPTEGRDSAEAVFQQPGLRQLAAGYVLYGPHCALALTVGSGTHVFTLDQGVFRLTHPAVTVRRDSDDYVINASNYRFWSESIRAYVDDCMAGTEGARGADVTMRWGASLVAEAHRVLVRGGVFLSPRDDRRGHERGRLRLVFEANPIALLMENAGAKAIDGFTRILELTPGDVRQRTPLMFGSAGEIDRLARYKANPSNIFERSPLFGQRGLLKV